MTGVLGAVESWQQLVGCLVFALFMSEGSRWLLERGERREIKQENKRRRACTHRRIVSVESGDETWAQLCLDCDDQLPADFASPGDR